MFDRFRQTYITKDCVSRTHFKKALIPMQNARRYSNLMALSDALSTISFKRGLVNKSSNSFTAGREAYARGTSIKDV